MNCHLFYCVKYVVKHFNIKHMRLIPTARKCALCESLDSFAGLHLSCIGTCSVHISLIIHEVLASRNLEITACCLLLYVHSYDIVTRLF